MNSLSVLLILNIVFSVGGIVGAALWLHFDDYFTLGGGYGFYWFTSVLSFLVGVVGYAYHSYSNVRENMSISKLSVSTRMYVMGLLAFVMFVFWLGASASVASYLQDCVYIKNKIKFFDHGYEFCVGEAVTTAFGFSDFIVWCIIVYVVGEKIVQSFNKPTEPTLSLIHI